MRVTLHTSGNISTIDYDPSVPCLIDTVREFLLSEELRAHMNKGLELLLEKKQIHGNIGWLANAHSISPLFEDDLRWIAEDWTLRVVQSGIQHIAIVVPTDVVSEMNIDVYEENLETVQDAGLRLKKFKNMESAIEWLRSSLKNSLD